MAHLQLCSDGEVEMKLYTYHRNSAGQRVRIALALKNLEYEYVSVPALGWVEFRKVNPQGLMPALEIEGRVIIQSMAIIEFLEERYPSPSLLPADPIARAHARAVAQVVACEMHAMTVNRVRRFLGSVVGAGDAVTDRWQAHWNREGLASIEGLLRLRTEPTRFAFDDRPTIADLAVVPQLYNARRFGCDLKPYPLVLAVETACVAHPAFRAALPENQPDFVAPGPSDDG